MKHFWALPAALRLVVGLERPFSVQNDLLAFPQFEVVFSESFISATEADTLSKASKNHDAAQRPQVHDASSQQPHHHGARQHVLDDDADAAETNGDSYERMVHNGTPYLCRIPYVAPELAMSANASATSQAEEQQELMRASHHGWELLSAMEGNCLYFGGGWWVYSFCYGESVRQFHALAPGRGVPNWPPTPDPAVFNFVLGKFNHKSAHKRDLSHSMDGVGELGHGSDMSPELQTRGETNFLVQRLAGGTVCDLTGDDRRIEIQYHCNPGSPDRINMIKETASCVYLMVIHTPRLCNDVAFQPPQLDRPNAIACQEIVTKEDEKRWKSIKAARAKDEIFTADGSKGDTPDEPRYINIGGIEVGAQKLVGGSPERQIKVSNIAKPRKPDDQRERVIVTLAESDGKKLTMLNEREIQKYDLKYSIEDIENLILDIQEQAEEHREGQPWRLVVYDTDEGIKFRGFLTNEDGSSPEEKSDSGKTGEGTQQQQQ